MNGKKLATLLAALFLFAIAFFLVSWRRDQAPDIFTDEILYTRAGMRVAGENALAWDDGQPLFVHPPLYFLLEGLLFRLHGVGADDLYRPGSIFPWVYRARLLNALLAGATSAILYWLGTRLQGQKLALLLAALFILDPFGLRINRRAMLETAAMAFSLAGMALLLAGLRPREPLGRGRTLLAGLLLGAGMLSKELAFTAPLAVFLYALWASWSRRSLRQAIWWTPLVACLTYLLYPLWAFSTGQWPRFVAVKWLSLQRLAGLVQLSGWNRPDVSLLSLLGSRLADYGSSYLLLALGAPATLFLWLACRHNRAARLLATWGLVLYPFYLFLALVGSGNDQFFYFLLVPALALDGYALAVFPDAVVRTLARHRRTRGWLVPAHFDRLRQAQGLILRLLLLALLPLNLFLWWQTFAVGVDNGYAQLAAFVSAQVPPGVPLNAGGDAIKYRYFFPERPIFEAGTVEEAQAATLEYFAITPKDVALHYGRLTPQLAGRVLAQGQRLFATNGESYGPILLYRLPVAAPPPESYALTLPRASNAGIGWLWLLLPAWALAVAALAAGRPRWQRPEPLLEWEGQS